MDIMSATNAFAALSQETRLSAFRLLVKSGARGIAAGDLAEHLGVKQNTMSANLSVLLHSGLVERRREGRSIIYLANFVKIRDLLAFLLEDCCGGNPALCEPFLDSALCCR